MFTTLRDLLKYDGRFRIAFIFLLAVLCLALLTLVSPYDPSRTYLVPPDMPPSLEYPFGTNSRGQDIFWWMAFAVRNSLLLGLLTAAVSRVIAVLVGLTAGYRGGMADRLLMSINDSFVVMPVLPILILLSFLMRGQLNLVMLGVLMGVFGWPWDARLIRAQVLSLKERPFTQTAVYSGTNAFWITIHEHLPFVLPVVFATTINNLIWAIGMEVTLSVLGLSDVTLPTIGTTIFWANQHQALVFGAWWWLAAPVLVAIILFLGLYLFFSSVNEYIDPRTRLRLIGG
ncbi:ABC transporter permease [Litorilinea aerophila]|uniref:ABC transporter permease n=1 Tax=Litorilinea aerophila TaxID=1204385 RepID=A0A540VCE6_9CHLR|nr:ABC transporter permease [Litorilinea aerophila]MCC9077777.1 ABC transporter permease [Litorilinea aerophila]GIV79032.1 MAG: peptide ABC transporter [Litorilinea sp.]